MRQLWMTNRPAQTRIYHICVTLNIFVGNDNVQEKFNTHIYIYHLIRRQVIPLWHRDVVQWDALVREKGMGAALTLTSTIVGHLGNASAVVAVNSSFCLLTINQIVLSMHQNCLYHLMIGIDLGCLGVVDLNDVFQIWAISIHFEAVPYDINWLHLKREAR